MFCITHAEQTLKVPFSRFSVDDPRRTFYHRHSPLLAFLATLLSADAKEAALLRA